MKARFRKFRRNGVFYSHDHVTGKQQSLYTTDKHEAVRLVAQKNESFRQPALNLQIARAYLMAGDEKFISRTWAYVMEQILIGKQGNTKVRWLSAIKDKAFDEIRRLPLIETKADDFLSVLNNGTVATNVFLRRLHNFAFEADWIPRRILPRTLWPKIEFGEKRAITEKEHQKILAGEQNDEWRAFYELCWYLGGAQSDVAKLSAEAVDWPMRVISFKRAKTDTPVQFHFSDALAALLKQLPTTGTLLPSISQMKQSDRAKAFIRRCKLVGVSGVSLHSYRYAWAERAKTCGYPERFAQEALGHNSKAVSRAYARKADVKLPSLEEYESAHEQKKLVPLFAANG